MKRIRGANRFTLIEICVAIAIVALGILTAMSILVPALTWAGQAQKGFCAAQAALTCANFLNAGGTMGGMLSPYSKTFGQFKVTANLTSPTLAVKAVPTDAKLTVYRLKIDPLTGNESATANYGASDELFVTIVKLYRER